MTRPTEAIERLEELAKAALWPVSVGGEQAAHLRRRAFNTAANPEPILSLIAHLRQVEEENVGLRAALEPFAALGDFDAALTERWPARVVDEDCDTVLAWAGGFDLKPPVITYGDLRRARSALTRNRGDDHG